MSFLCRYYQRELQIMDETVPKASLD